MALQREISNVLSYVTSRGYQIHPEAFAMLKNLNNNLLIIVKKIINDKIENNENNSLIIIEDIKKILSNIDKQYYDSDDSTNNNNIVIHKSNKIIQKKEKEQNSETNVIKIKFDPTSNISSAEGIDGYSSLFKSRYEKLLNILSMRQESKRLIKISILKNMSNLNNNNSGSRKYLRNEDNNNEEKRSRKNNNLENSNFDSFIIAGLVMDRQSKKNGIEITIDDQTGMLTAIALTEELKKQVSLVALDQMVMLEIENRKNNKAFVLKKITAPDIPEHIPNKAQSDSYVILISDLHVGSKYFLEDEFNQFIDWLSNSDNEIVSKIKYLCIGGDLIDGVGIFPNQEKELVDLTIKKQMNHVINLLARIPSRIKVFVIPGNHDTGRRALPQPSIPRKDAEELYMFENFTMLGNPCLLELEGVKILMYHGQSLDDIIATIPGLSYSKPAEAMKILLKARHLSPIYGQRTPIGPEKEDMMVISEIPDILHSGHVHVMDVQNYKGTLIVNSGAWQAQTKFQQTMNILPTPGIAIAVNLSTLQPFQIDFKI